MGQVTGGNSFMVAVSQHSLACLYMEKIHCGTNGTLNGTVLIQDGNYVFGDDTSLQQLQAMDAMQWLHEFGQ
eukprot:11830918-Karenia_brevis.AAC.1